MLAVASPQACACSNSWARAACSANWNRSNRGGGPVLGDSAVLAQTAHELANICRVAQRVLACRWTGGHAFQLSAWQALPSPSRTRQTQLRARQARAISRPAPRAVAVTANGQNKVSIIIACHCVIGSDGSLTGFGGGLPPPSGRFTGAGGGAAQRDWVAEGFE